MSAFWNFLSKQLFSTPQLPPCDAAEQTIIVTGSNVGLGLEAARHFVRLDAKKVILAVRSVEKGDKAKKSIEESTQRSGVVEVWQLDLSSYESVKQFATKAQSLQRLDAVVENAGIATQTYRMLEDNEATITTNVVSTFLLALLLLPKMRDTATKFNVIPHLSVVSSEVHGWTQFPERNSANIFKTLNDKETANMAERYPLSKLLEVFCCRELAARHSQSSSPHVIINYLTPGLCHSELTREAGIQLMIMKFFFARTTEVGSRTLVHGALAGPESHGNYLDDCKVTEPAPLVMSSDGRKAQAKVWEELSQKLETIQVGVMSNV